MNIPVAILAGGLATRLRPISEKIPKALVDIGGKPFIQHQIELLKKSGLDRFILCCGYLGEQIQEFLGNGKQLDVQIEYSFDGDKLLGTGGALKKAEKRLGDTFLYIYGDSYLRMNYREMINQFRVLKLPALMAVFRNNNKWDKSNVFFFNNLVISYDKKNPTDEMDYIDYGCGILTKGTLDRIPNDQFYDLAGLLNQLALEKKLAGFEVNERFYEVGSFQGIKELNELLLYKT